MPSTTHAPDVIDAVGRARMGDRGAFRRLVAVYQNAVTTVALVMVRNVALSEDVAQDAFFEAWRSLPKLRRDESFGPWLLQLTRRKALQALRRDRRADRRDQRWYELLPPVATETSHPPVAPGEEDQYKDMYAVLEQLPDDAREILILYYREGHSTHQVAALLELSEPAVRKRLERARAALRDRFESTGQLAHASAPTLAFLALVLDGLDAAAAPTSNLPPDQPFPSPAPPMRLAPVLASLAMVIAATATAAALRGHRVTSRTGAAAGAIAKSAAGERASAAPLSTRSAVPLDAGAEPVAASLDGKVVDASGKAASARVALTLQANDGPLGAPGPTVGAPVATAEDGTFHVGGLAPGVYRAIAETDAQRTILEGIHLPAGGSYFADLRLHEMVAPLVGRVVDDTGVPVGDRTLNLRGPNAAPTSIAVAADGTFTLARGYPVGDVRIYVSRKEATISLADATALGVTPVVANAAWGQFVRVTGGSLRIVVPREGTLYGELVAAPSARAGAERPRFVKLMRTEEIGGMFTFLPQVVPVAEDRTFTVSVPAGRYALEAVPGGAVDSAVIAAGAVYRSTLRYGAPPTFRVRVLEPNGSPAIGANVVIGNLRVESADDHGVAMLFDRAASSLVGEKIWVENGARAAHLEIPRDAGDTMTVRLSAPGRLRGRVLRQDGGPMLTSRLTISNTNAHWACGGPVGLHFSGATFDVMEVAAGETKVEIQTEDGLAGVGTVVVPSGGEAQLDVVVTGVGFVHGRVVPASGSMPRPLPMVILLGKARHVAEDGDFVLPDLAPGRYSLEIQALGKTVASREIAVRANDTLQLGEIQFQAPPDCN